MEHFDRIVPSGLGTHVVVSKLGLTTLDSLRWTGPLQCRW